jgi:CubicO group peptidase (beta-lactamase class C family)
MLEGFVGRRIEKKAFPGMTILAAERGRIRWQRRFGFKALWPDKQPLTPDTLYDLASLTKPLVTAFLAVHCIEKKQWHLQDEVRRFFPEFPLALTVEQLLTHSSGLPPWLPFYLYRPRSDMEQIAAVELQAAPGRAVLYSDAGYILLRHLLEKTTGAGFKEAAAEIIFKPLGLNETFLSVPEALKPRCAPTEVGNRFERGMCRGGHERAAARFPWRTELIQGDVHDANSFYAGGSAGNAGLFSSAGDLFRLGREFFPETATLLKARSIRLFWENRTPWSVVHRSLGFKVNSSQPTSGGHALAPTAIGHTGFTGTSLWLESESQRQYIILTNRVHPRVKKADFDATRRALHELIRREADVPQQAKTEFNS